MKTVEMDLTVGGLHFEAKLPRAETQKDAVEARYLIAFERFVVEKLCKHASPSPDGFKYLRTRTRLKSNEFAELIGVTPETVSRWEHEKNDMPPLAWEVMVSIAEEKLQGRTETLDRLRERQKSRQNPPKLLKMPSVKELVA